MGEYVVGEGSLVQGPQWLLGNTHHIDAVIVHEGLEIAKQEGG